MNINIKKSKIHICKYCKNTSEVVGIIQKETHYYSFDLETRQRNDFHGDESVESQEFFCINCNGKIDEPEEF